MNIEKIEAKTDVKRNGEKGMIIEDFVPKSNEELINKLNNGYFKGNFYLENNIIYWKYNDLIILKIILFNQPDESYIEYSDMSYEGIPVDELFEFLIELNNMEIKMVIKKSFFKKEKKYVDFFPSSNVINDIMNFEPYKNIGKFKFGNGKKSFGKIDKEYVNYNGSKTVMINNHNNIHMYFNNKDKLNGVHFFNSIIFKMNNKFFSIDFNSFKIDDLKLISDDFIVTVSEEGNDYTSKKLGIDFYFNENDCLEAVLFMSEEYIQKEVDFKNEKDM